MPDSPNIPAIAAALELDPALITHTDLEGHRHLLTFPSGTSPLAVDVAWRGVHPTNAAANLMTNADGVHLRLFFF
jgi:hypothetical protein